MTDPNETWTWWSGITQAYREHAAAEAAKAPGDQGDEAEDLEEDPGCE